MTDSVKDLFSAHSDIYVKYRPLYPPELYDFLVGKVIRKDAALDCGTGNGQAASVLANHFKQVHATDISEKQIANAIQKANLHYHVCLAEQTPFADNSFDLITSATAVHWFNFDRFFNEVIRIGKNNSVFACWAYNIFRTDDKRINALIDKFYAETIRDYWDPERRHVDEEYKNVPMPFREIANPGFATRLQWDLDTIHGYLNTWSAVQHYIGKHNINPVEELIHEMKSVLQDKISLQVMFPVFMRMGQIIK